MVESISNIEKLEFALFACFVKCLTPIFDVHHPLFCLSSTAALWSVFFDLSEPHFPKRNCLKCSRTCQLQLPRITHKDPSTELLSELDVLSQLRVLAWGLQAGPDIILSRRPQHGVVHSGYSVLLQHMMRILWALVRWWCGCECKCECECECECECKCECEMRM